MSATNALSFRVATQDDAMSLAELNHQLIHDEGHRNPMTVPELAERMRDWLSTQYQAVIFEQDDRPIGYALYRRDPEFVYLRQLFVCRNVRRQGIGRTALVWLRRNVWGGDARIRMDVLFNNTSGIAFWRAVGFRDYSIKMELENTSNGTE